MRSEARKARAEESGGSALTSEVDDAVRLKEEAEAALDKNRASWSEHRTELEAEISKLEGRLVEALERGSNPVRSAGAEDTVAKARIEGRIKEAAAEARAVP